MFPEPTIAAIGLVISWFPFLPIPGLTEQDRDVTETSEFGTHGVPRRDVHGSGTRTRQDDVTFLVAVSPVGINMVSRRWP
jgi:hypothetical protein